jgi:hypothetical protein
MGDLFTQRAYAVSRHHDILAPMMSPREKSNKMHQSQGQEYEKVIQDFKHGLKGIMNVTLVKPNTHVVDTVRDRDVVDEPYISVKSDYRQLGTIKFAMKGSHIARDQRGEPLFKFYRDGEETTFQFKANEDKYNINDLMYYIKKLQTKSSSKSSRGGKHSCRRTKSLKKKK